LANNIFQVKRTSTSGRTPNTTSSSNSQYINAGEFALNMTDKILYTSDGTNLITIGSNTVNHNVTNTISIGNSSVNSSINSTSFSGTSNNSLNLGGVAAANVVSNAQLQSNLSNYQTTAGLSANVATLAANSSTYANQSITNTFTVGTAAYHVSNGNMGIGTSTPAYKLDVNGLGRIQGLLFSASGDQYLYDSGGGSASIRAGTGGTDVYYAFYANGQFAALGGGGNGGGGYFNGNLGIACTSPVYTLDAVGTGRFSKILAGAITQTATDASTIRTNGDIYMDAAVSTLAYNLYYNSGWYYRNTGPGFAWRSDGTSVMQLFAAASGTGGTSATPSATVSFASNGNIGFGTSTPAYKLDVNGNLNVSNSISIAGNQAVNGPSFSAYQTSSQSISSGVSTKVQLQSKEWDTNSCFDATTNYRFTPTVAGYYQISGGVNFSTLATSITFVSIYKNGGEYRRLTQTYSSVYGIEGSAIVYLNGTTDYVELYCFQYNGSSLSLTVETFFQGVMVRGA